ncbi:hypothetical protein MPTK1_7g17780 [Marchantia polymorpha subsp. ruderalis]
MQKCFEVIMTHNIPDCLVIINANQNSMAILEANQLQIPIVALVDSNIPNRLHKVITYPVLAKEKECRAEEERRPLAADRCAGDQEDGALG